MATVQSEVGRIRIFEDFEGAECPVADTLSPQQLGKLRICGETIADNDVGATSQEADPCLNGVIRLTTSDEDNHSICLTTAKIFTPSLNGTLVAECRVQFDDLDTKEFFFGFSDENDDDQGCEGDILHGETATITLTASDLCGFLLSSELTEDEMWHCVYNGGTTTGVTDSTAIESDVNAVLAEYNILRVEIDNNGTARWYVDGVLKQTVEGAVSTTSTDLFAAQAIIEVKGTAGAEYADIDYFLIEASRDWTK